MKASKREKLEAAGWRVGSADEFLEPQKRATFSGHDLTNIGDSGIFPRRYRYVCFCARVGEWLDEPWQAVEAHAIHRLERSVGASKKIVVEWRQLTANCWVANLPGGLSLAVNRNRSWKALKDAKPFKVTVFGNIYAHPTGFAFLEDAQVGAELIARKVIRDLTGWATETAALRG